MDGWMDGWVGGWVDGWIDGRIDGNEDYKKTVQQLSTVRPKRGRTITVTP